MAGTLTDEEFAEDQHRRLLVPAPRLAQRAPDRDPPGRQHRARPHHPTGSGNAPDVDLHGDTVLVEIGDELTLVDWRSGDRDPVATKGSGVAFHGSYGAGRYIVGDTGFGEPVEHWQVRSWTDGALVGEYPGGATAELSPDGRYLKVGGDSAFTVYDVASGDPVSEGEGASRFGWSPDGHVVGPASNPQVLFVRGAQNQDQSAG